MLKGLVSSVFVVACFSLSRFMRRQQHPGRTTVGHMSHILYSLHLEPVNPRSKAFAVLQAPRRCITHDLRVQKDIQEKFQVLATYVQGPTAF